MSNTTQYEQFWKERENALGQPVLVHSLVRTMTKNAPPEWGLLYATAKAVYFQTFASSNWFDQLVFKGKNQSKRFYRGNTPVPNRAARTNPRE